MADKLKSVHCVRDLRNAPLEEYKFPDDGRTWKHVARNRQALANFLATFADGDGSRIFPTVETMTKHFGWSRATTFRLLADLRALNLLSEKIGLHGESGPAIRKMDVVGFRQRTFTGSAALVQNAFSGVSNSGDQESQAHASGVSGSGDQESHPQEQESQAQEQESHPLWRHIPPRFTATETATSTATNSQTEEQAGGWRLLEEKHMAEIGYFGRKATDFQKYIDDYGFDIVDAATKAALADGNLEDVKSRVGCIVHRLGQKLAAEVKMRHRAEQKKTEEEFQAASIERQTQEIIARRDKRWDGAPQLTSEEILARGSDSLDDFLNGK
jgi:hypothetical protein